MNTKKKSIFRESIALYLLILLVLSFGLIDLYLGIRREVNTNRKNFDDRLYEVMLQTDKNLKNQLDDFERLLKDFADSELLHTAERSYEKKGSIKALLAAMRGSVLRDFPQVSDLVTIKDGQVIACTTCGKHCNLSFYGGVNQDFAMCEDGGEIFLAIFCDGGNEDYRYAVTINLHSLYMTIRNEAFASDTQFILLDESNGIFVRNMKKQSYIVHLNMEEGEKEDSIYGVICRSVLQREAGFTDWEFDSRKYRLIVNHAGDSANEVFALALVMDQTMFLSEMKQALFITTTGIFMVLLSVAAFALYLLYLRQDYKRTQRNLEMLSLKQETLELKDSLLLARMKNSKSQMQPHFLYNALASIREIVLDDPDYAADLIYDFTTHLRACIRYMSNDDRIPFSKELENIGAYVNIEKMRFGDRLTVEYELGASDFFIVPLSIQPFVENAIRHGIFERGRRGGTVWVKSYQDEEHMIIEISDNGVGFDKDKVFTECESGERDSTGIQNNIFRLEKLMKGGD